MEATTSPACIPPPAFGRQPATTPATSLRLAASPPPAEGWQHHSPPASRPAPPGSGAGPEGGWQVGPCGSATGPCGSATGGGAATALDAPSPVAASKLGWVDSALQQWPVRTAVAGMGFLADQYDLYIVATCSTIMYQLYPNVTTAEKAGITVAALIGSVLGQLFFGAFGDIIGRRITFFATATLVIIGALGSATPTVAAAQTTGVGIYMQLMIWRGLLGFGIGGEYPLAATVTSEAAGNRSRGKAIAAVFSMQGVGRVLGAFVIWACVASTLAGNDVTTPFSGPLPPVGSATWRSLDIAWRLAFACGAIPSLCIVYFRWRMHETTYFTRVLQEDAGIVRPLHKSSSVTQLTAQLAGATPADAPVVRFANIRAAARILWEFRWTLLGTSIGWFLIDVTFYGQGLQNALVLQVAGVAGNKATQTNIQYFEANTLGSLALAAIALPGYFVGIALIDRMGRFWMQLMGFVVSGVVFAILGACYTPLTQNAGGAFVFLYGLTFFFADFGPNLTTFVIPAEAFPTRIRSTAHGISAATGKLGATFGSYVLVYVLNMYCANYTCPSSANTALSAGLVNVMYVSAGVCAAGAVGTMLLTRESGNKTLEEVDASSKVVREIEDSLRHAAALNTP